MGWFGINNVIGWVGFNFPLVFLVGCEMDIKVIRFGYGWEWIGFFAISRPSCRAATRATHTCMHDAFPGLDWTSAGVVACWANGFPMESKQSAYPGMRSAAHGVHGQGPVQVEFR
jgi:hypothetical protein